jgi:hypothetical protein
MHNPNYAILNLHTKLKLGYGSVRAIDICTTPAERPCAQFVFLISIYVVQIFITFQPSACGCTRSLYGPLHLHLGGGMFAFDQVEMHGHYD